MEIEWDEKKDAAHQAKHGVSFEEAKTVFEDPLYVDFYDPIILTVSTGSLSSANHFKGAF